MYVPYFSLHKTRLGFRGEKQEKKHSEPMDCRHSTGDDQRLRTQYRG
ncbi:unnamed protein product [Staurois parvus]|uniref:Uncharacterized protein n=1 Tax=Staurois parvus TaxID=386267 RepID=A0ABN9FXH5_9NEOB|nr:unnamed protein product [Staurois parvus]